MKTKNNKMEETLEEALSKVLESKKYPTWLEIAIIGAEWKKERSFSNDEVFKIINDYCFDWNYNYKGELSQKEYLIEWFEKLKK